MRLTSAALSGVLLFGASLLLLWAADEAMDASAIAGGTGVVISGALLGLTYLCWRWRGGGTRYTVSIPRERTVYEELDAASHAESGIEDAAAV